jgi:S-adenosylmethionine:tRNA ribosyltransferase-isomerase
MDKKEIPLSDILVKQWDPYLSTYTVDAKVALQAILNYFSTNEMELLDASTQILIAPGYKFKLVNALITNYHQPKSTLLLLIAAFIGEKWNEVYHYALKNEFRFLSYGDSSLLFRKE